MTHKGRDVDFGYHTGPDGKLHYSIEIAGVTVWRRSVSDSHREEAEREMRLKLDQLREEDQNA